VDTATPVRS